MRSFYEKYYGDCHKRKLILGINPGRHGAGVTGIPFTDTKRLNDVLGISATDVHSHEVSAVFVYDLIAAYGGPEAFYGDYFIHSLFPLALIQNKNGKPVNANYYDSSELFQATRQDIIQHLEILRKLPVDLNNVFVLGKKNAGFLDKINTEIQFTGNITVLEHPRYIQQYKKPISQEYIDKFLKLLTTGN